MRESDQQTGIVLSEAQLEDRKRDYRNRFQTNDLPDYLANYQTIEDRDENLSRAALDEVYARKGYLTPQDIANHPFSVETITKVITWLFLMKQLLHQMMNMQRQAKAEIKGDTVNYFSSQGQKNRTDGEFARFENNAYNDYKLEYARLRRQNVGELDAHNGALKIVRDKMHRDPKREKSIYEDGFRDSSSQQKHCKIMKPLHNSFETTGTT